LSPADYGCIAILDLTSGLMAILIGSGIAAAVSRYHFEIQDEAKRSAMWWTGEVFVMLLSTAVVVFAWLSRDTLAYVTLGDTHGRGAYYYTLVLLTLWLNTVGQIPSVYLRVRKYSGIAVAISFAHLLFNIALNVYFVAALGKGVVGILLGNLIALGTTTIFLVAIFYWHHGKCTLQWPFIGEFLRFGSPLMATSILALVMHDADRYLLRLFLNMDQVGVYSVAYKIGHAMEILIHSPFAAIWLTAVYEVAHQPEAKQVYARVFQIYVYILMVVMLGVSLFARPMLSLMVAREYTTATNLIPIICLAYLFFSLSEHFRVPAMIHKQTTKTLPAALVSAAVNLVANVLLIPILGLSGAALATLITFTTHSVVLFYICRKIDQIKYPFTVTGGVLLAMISSYLFCYFLEAIEVSDFVRYTTATTIWLFWVLFLLESCFGKELRNKAFAVFAQSRQY
jgi:O-antigen/teichoic acid export membrane protein